MRERAAQWRNSELILHRYPICPLAADFLRPRDRWRQRKLRIVNQETPLISEVHAGHQEVTQGAPAMIAERKLLPRSQWGLTRTRRHALTSITFAPTCLPFLRAINKLNVKPCQCHTSRAIKRQQNKLFSRSPLCVASTNPQMADCPFCLFSSVLFWF